MEYLFVAAIHDCVVCFLNYFIACNANISILYFLISLRHIYNPLFLYRVRKYHDPILTSFSKSSFWSQSRFYFFLRFHNTWRASQSPDSFTPGHHTGVINSLFIGEREFYTLQLGRCFGIFNIINKYNIVYAIEMWNLKRKLSHRQN